MQLNQKIKNKARTCINIRYVFSFQSCSSFSTHIENKLHRFYLRSAKPTPSQLTRRNLPRVLCNWGWISSQQCCQTHECLFLHLGRRKPPVTSCINWPLDRYLYFYLQRLTMTCTIDVFPVLKIFGRAYVVFQSHLFQCLGLN